MTGSALDIYGHAMDVLFPGDSLFEKGRVPGGEGSPAASSRDPGG